MTKFIYLSIVCFAFSNCKSGNTNSQFGKDSLFQVSNLRSFSINEYVIENIQPFVDSLNNYTLKKDLPCFLYDANFDYQDSLLNDWNKRIYISRRLERIIVK